MDARDTGFWSYIAGLELWNVLLVLAGMTIMLIGGWVIGRSDIVRKRHVDDMERFQTKYAKYPISNEHRNFFDGIISIGRILIVATSAMWLAALALVAAKMFQIVALV